MSKRSDRTVNVGAVYFLSDCAKIPLQCQLIPKLEKVLARSIGSEVFFSTT